MESENKLQRYEGIYKRDGTNSEALLQIELLHNGQFEVKGSAFWGKENLLGPNIGKINFITDIIDNKMKFNDELDGKKIILNIMFLTNGLEIKEHYIPNWFGYFGMNVTFEGKYQKV